MAALSVVVAITMELCARVAVAFWSASKINSMLGIQEEGLTTQAMQQGGIGLLMTVLIITVPPMAALFFNGTMGNFLFNSTFGSYGGQAAAVNAGLPVGAYGSAARPAPSATINHGSSSAENGRMVMPNSASEFTRDGIKGGAGRGR